MIGQPMIALSWIYQRGERYMSWWTDQVLRLIQTNLTVKDIDLDRNRLIDNLKRFHANTLLLNVGGVVSFFPSRLSCQNPLDKHKDLVGEMVELCHQNGIRVIGRFDFSKVAKRLADAHPEWTYRDRVGAAINYNGFVHTCPSGEYQQVLAPQIVDEALGLYPLDGVFFNMPGYRTMDYSHVYHGICQCEACKRQFHESTGMELPIEEDLDSPAYQMYLAFQKRMVQKMHQAIREVVKRHSNEIAVAMYSPDGSDIFMAESNTELHRPYPVWEYMASENAMVLNGSWPEKILGNIMINASSLDNRFMSVSPWQMDLRCHELMANGAGLAFCIIGDFPEYPDTKNFSVVQENYAYLEENERWYQGFRTVADIALIKPTHPSAWQQEAYRGAFKALKQNHYSFTVVDESAVSFSMLNDIPLVLVPGLQPTERLLEVLDALPCKVVYTGVSATNSTFERWFGLREIDTKPFQVQGAYITNPPSFQQTRWTLLQGPCCTFKGKQGDLELRDAGMFGPPEMCGGNVPTGRMFRHQGPKGFCYSFQPDALFKKYGFDEHKLLLLDGVDRCLSERSMESDAPEAVELVYNRYNGGGANLQCVNLSGYDGSSFHRPFEAGPFTVRLRYPRQPHSVNDIVEKRLIACSWNNGVLELVIDHLGSYRMIVIDK